MSATMQRLIELMHIYNQMIKTPFEKPNLFLANLNSFIALARSITLVMQKEFHDVSGFDEWYATKQNEMKNDDGMKFFLDLRNESLHEKSVGKILYKLTLLDTYTLKSGETCTWPALKSTNEGTLALDDKNKFLKINGIPRPDIRFEYTVDYFFVDRPNISARTLCLTHFQKIDTLTTECNKKFSHLIK